MGNLERLLVDLRRENEVVQVLIGRPPRWAHGSLYLLIGLLVTSLTWTFLAKVDVVMSAPGVVQRSEEVTPPETKWVVAAYAPAREGDWLRHRIGAAVTFEIDELGYREQSIFQGKLLQVDRTAFSHEDFGRVVRFVIGMDPLGIERGDGESKIEEGMTVDVKIVKGKQRIIHQLFRSFRSDASRL